MGPIRKILIASDAWHPQVNGVVRTLDTTIKELTRTGHTIKLVEPGLFANHPLPLYPEIRLAWPVLWEVENLIDDFRPDAIHICTEATIGAAVRKYCKWRSLRFTTSYHTKFPEYLYRMIGLPEFLSYGYLRWFHRRSAAVMVATPSVEEELREQGFAPPLVRWSRGVNLELFHPRPRTFPEDHRPVLIYVGRVSAEKGLEDFLRLRTPGKKYVVGDGPARAILQEKYKGAVFLGKLHGEELAAAYANADVFVFPSKTDTFGLVVLEALASGVPVAAYPVPGPIDILTDERAGALHEDLGTAVELALRRGRREACLALARQYTWERCTRQFVRNLVPVRPPEPTDEELFGLAPVAVGAAG
jgi:glycosyltransferase involved in cell wall biosynthesis